MLKYIGKGGMKMKLSEGKISRDYRVCDILLDLNIKRRLEMLGMTHNTIIRVMNKKRAGPMIIKIRGTRFALGKGFCDGIFVEETNE